MFPADEKGCGAHGPATQGTMHALVPGRYFGCGLAFGLGTGGPTSAEPAWGGTLIGGCADGTTCRAVFGSGAGVAETTRKQRTLMSVCPAS